MISVLLLEHKLQANWAIKVMLGVEPAIHAISVKDVFPAAFKFTYSLSFVELYLFIAHFAMSEIVLALLLGVVGLC